MDPKLSALADIVEELHAANRSRGKLTKKDVRLQVIAGAIGIQANDRDNVWSEEDCAASAWRIARHALERDGVDYDSLPEDEAALAKVGKPPAPG